MMWIFTTVSWDRNWRVLLVQQPHHGAHGIFCSRTPVLRGVPPGNRAGLHSSC
jgi:hypothetical protein